jgi:hypothetical protein
MLGAAAERGVTDELAVLAALPPADVLVPQNQACVLHRPPQDLLKRSMGAEHRAVGSRKDELRGGTLHGLFQGYGTASCAMGITSACPPFVVSAS